jgi:hypothetical protein
MTLSGEMPKRNVIGRFVEENKKTIVEVISALFIFLFLYTAISKSFNIEKTVNVLEKAPGFSQYALAIAWITVVTEYLIAGLLYLPKTRKMGLYSFTALMTMFTGYIIYMKAFAATLPCSCGGIISKLSWNQHLIFNIFSILLAVFAILLLRSKSNTNNTEPTQIVFT